MGMSRLSNGFFQSEIIQLGRGSTTVLKGINAMRKYKDYEESLKVRLADSAYAKEYLTVALEEYEEDGNTEAFLLAVKDVVNAQGSES